MKIKPRRYALSDRLNSVVSVPEGKSGKWEVRHVVLPPEIPLPHIDPKTDFMNNNPNRWSTRDKPYYIHCLMHGDDCVACDLDHNVAAMETMSIVSGRILIGGLGLGMLYNLVTRRKNISQIIVIESNRQVIDLIWEHLEHNPEHSSVVIEGNIEQVLQEADTTYDWGLFDITPGETRADIGKITQLKRLAKNCCARTKSYMENELDYSL